MPDSLPQNSYELTYGMQTSNIWGRQYFTSLNPPIPLNSPAQEWLRRMEEKPVSTLSNGFLHPKLTGDDTPPWSPWRFIRTGAKLTDGLTLEILPLPPAILESRLADRMPIRLSRQSELHINLPAPWSGLTVEVSTKTNSEPSVSCRNVYMTRCGPIPIVYMPMLSDHSWVAVPDPVKFGPTHSLADLWKITRVGEERPK